MKRKRFSAVLVCILTLAILAGIAIPLASAAEQTITFLNPLGIVVPPANDPLTDRPDNYNEKTVKLVYYGSANNTSHLTLRALGECLVSDFPGTAITETAMSSIAPDTMYDAKEDYESLAQDADAIIIGVVEDNVGAWWASYHAKQIEALGVPVVVVTNSWWDSAVKCGAEDNGFAAMRTASFDRELYADAYSKPTAGNVRFSYLKSQVELLGVYANVKAALTVPPTEAERSRAPLDPAVFGDIGDITLTVTGSSYAKAVQKFHDLSMEMNFGDGLPLNIPTREAVDALLATTDRAPDEIIGRIMLRGGLITVEKVAINAAMADARPEFFPAILAAVEAYATGWEDDKLFYQATMANEQATLMLVFSGPMVDQLDIGNGRAFDPGSEGEGVIGRAVKLCIRNIGHVLQEHSTIINAFYRINDHELYVVGESNEYLPAGWKTHSEMLGFPAGSNSVTLIATTRGQLTTGAGSGTATAESFLNTLRTQVNTAAGRNAPGIYAINWTQAEMAARATGVVAGMGLDTKEAVQTYIANNVNRNALVWPIVCGFGHAQNGRAWNTTATYNTRGFQAQLINEKGDEAITPSTPADFEVIRTADGTEATLTWKAPLRTGDNLYYQVSNDGGATWIDNGAAFTYTFNNLDPSIKYIFFVRAVNDVYNSVDIERTGSGSDYVWSVSDKASGRGAWAGAVVKTAPSDIRIDGAALTTAKKNTTKQLTVTVMPEGAETEIVWSSTNPAIASVDENGLVTMNATGTAVITAKTADGKLASTVTIRVTM